MLAALLALALSVQVGDKAPALTPDKWVGDAPDLAGKAVMVEFWGTWCGPCVAAMPHVQDVWARYREQGLVVVAVSYESTDLLSGWAQEHGLTMPMASDPEKKLVEAFGIDGWPTTFVIGKDGKVLYRGWPSNVEPFVQQALGIESSPVTLLDQYVKGEAEAKAALEQLARVAGHEFDLAAWARGMGAAPAPKPPKDPGESLSKAASARGTPLAASQLADLAALTAPFDLGGWAARELGQRYPLTLDELKQLLEAERYADALQAIVSRNPADKVLARAKGDDAFRDWCHERVTAMSEQASFVVLVGHWTFGEYEPPNEMALPPGVGVSFDESRKSIDGFVLPDGEELMRADFPARIEGFLAQTLAVQAFSRRKLPGDLAKGASKMHAELLAELKKKYGSKAKAVPKPD
jgi:peroxiredoxin